MMTMTGKLYTKTALTVLLALFTLILATACGSQQSPSASAGSSSASAESAESASASASASAGADSADSAAASEGSSSAPVNASDEYERALSAKGIVTGFIGEQFYEKSIESDEDALAAVTSAIGRVGGDETTALELVNIRPTETGTTYYTFCQRAGDVIVHGASVKLVVDKDHKAIGLVSAVLPNVKIEDLESWEITAEQAEQAVLAECKSNGADDARIIKDATHQTLIALEDGSAQRRYAWVVYTNNYLPDVDAGYLAHYVSADGDYLYAIPVSEPSNADALAGDEAAFDFGKMKEGTWSGTVTKSDGTKMDITVPTLTDPDTGEVYLADGKRKILCGDYAEFTYNGKIAPRVDTGDGFANNELIIYDAFIRIWDYYASIGWIGPDDEGTPTLLKMDMVDQGGNVVRNAYYEGRLWGFQMFAFNREEPDGECIDIMGHEFTHCVTGTTMTSNLYINDLGAINEAMSDIMGNLIEMSIAYDEKGAWIIGENGLEVLRSMKDPHAYQQPEFAWDEYYGPAVAEPTVANDNGGVHINSSLLNLVSYKLDQAGMPISDQVYFWMNVALAMTPSTDYPQIAELLPWCMEQAGYPQYVDAVKKAVGEGRFTMTEAPAESLKGSGIVKGGLSENSSIDASGLRIVMTPKEGAGNGGPILSWIGAGTNTFVVTVPAGDYTINAVQFDGDDTVALFTLTDSGWVQLDNGSNQNPNSKVLTVEAGATVELPSIA